MKRERLFNFWKFIWPYIVIIIVVLFMISPELIHHKALIGADTGFHWGRFYDAAMQIKTGKYNLFQTNFAFQQNGRVINAMYGPAFAYLNGAIVLLVKTWFNYQIVSDILICLVGAATMLYLLEYIGINKFLALTFSLIYINIGMIPNYIAGNAFNGWGQALMPLILLCGVRMLLDKNKPINWLQLGIIVAIVFQIHVLSTLMAIILLIPFFVISLFLNKNKLQKEFIALLKAIGLFILLTANMWGSILVLYSKNQLVSTDPANLSFSVLKLSKSALIPTNGYYGIVNAQVTLLFVLIILITTIISLKYWRKNLVAAVTLLFGVVLLLIMTKYFHWGFIQNKLPILKTNFQFVYRLVVIAYPLLIVGIASCFQELISQNKVSYKFLAGIGTLILLGETVLITPINCQQFLALHPKPHIQKMVHTTNLAKYAVRHRYGKMPDYLPYYGKPTKNMNYKAQKLYSKIVYKNYKKYHHAVLNNGNLKLSWSAKRIKKVELPVFMYKQSELILNSRRFTGKKNIVGNPIVEQRRGNNTAILHFRVPRWFYILIWLCILSWLGVATGSVVQLKNKIKSSN